MRGSSRPGCRKGRIYATSSSLSDVYKYSSALLQVATQLLLLMLHPDSDLVG